MKYLLIEESINNWCGGRKTVSVQRILVIWVNRMNIFGFRGSNTYRALDLISRIQNNY